ncbi:MAG: M20/M25/M40 family metallo-hydrolase [Elusimicrobiota bacterium]|nr:M20/M25/M40 family metallo-hydrolase [Elusimicrobiota bacterium]
MLLPLLTLLLSSTAAAADLAADMRRETIMHTKALIRLDTSNPPGNELIAARYIKSALEKDGIPVELFTSTGTRTSAVARLKGDGSKKPLLLMCHTDVVPADPKGWTVPPFEAVMKDDYLYGRGAADVKSLCAAEMAVMSYLARSKTPLARDVIFFAEADEENGTAPRHIEVLLKQRPDLVDAELGLNEGGRMVWQYNRVTEIRVQAAEKEYMDLTLTAKGRPGHSSRPTPDNAVARLARAVAKLAAHRFPVRLNPVSQAFLERQIELDASVRVAARGLLAAPEGPRRDEAADKLMAVSPELAATARETVTPTMLEAGYKSNVIPAVAKATLNARLLPGRRAEDLIADIKAVIADPGIEASFEPPTRAPVGPMPLDTELYAAIVKAAAKRDPAPAVMPFMAAWTTDSADLRARGTVMYGIDPPMTDEDDLRMHGDDERVSMSGLDWFSDFLREVVVATAGKGR